MNENSELFKVLDGVIFDHKGSLNPAEFFRLLSEYQLTRINDIEKSNNKQQAMALNRTALYDTTLFESFKKTTSVKKKEKMVFKLVNLLCIANDSLDCLSSDYDKEIFNILIEYKDKILSNEDWYNRIIPESKWLIEYFKQLKNI